jgi:hypothetical protein
MYRIIITLSSGTATGFLNTNILSPSCMIQMDTNFTKNNQKKLNSTKARFLKNEFMYLKVHTE